MVSAIRNHPDDLNVLFAELSFAYNVRLYDRDSLIVFDEVQRCPQARQLVKALVADGRYDYIETGSLISLRRNVKNITIPSEEEAVGMYPMDFEEFLDALGDRPFTEGALYEEVYSGDLGINEGMVIENSVAQALTAAGRRLFFYSRYDLQTAANRMEIDFLIRRGNAGADL